VHHRVPIPDFPGSYALAAEAEQVKMAIVFVHGFLGDAFRTWVDFQTRIEEEAVLEEADLYFFAYDSFGSSVGASVNRLLELVARLEHAPAQWFEVQAGWLPPPIRETLGSFRLRSSTTNYERLILVGHSLGGVVLREAIRLHARDLIAALGNSGAAGVPIPWMLGGALRLFAPAISGARPAGLYGLALRLGGIGALARAVLGASPSYAYMRPETGLLGDLRAKTEELAQRFPALSAFSADVLWAERDDVVEDRDYFCDRTRGRARGKDHITVCKPTGDYRQPLDLVSRGQV
jgi:pimeloyl-ACP methyl ester carboxylesterase